MAILRLIFNVITVAAELALVGAAGWLAWQHPHWLAGLTAVLAMGLGLRLEVLRLEHEATFYFERVGGLGRWWRVVAGLGEAVLRALLAGAVTLITFSGTDPSRASLLALAFAGCIFIGSSVLRRLTLSLGVRPARWGYFRMAIPLGLAFSLVLAFMPPVSLGSVVWSSLLDLPMRPSLARFGEALFNIRQWVDDMVVRMLAVWLGPQGARIAAIVVSTNVLAGFVIAVYAVAVSEVVRTLEEWKWRLTTRKD